MKFVVNNIRLFWLYQNSSYVLVRGVGFAPNFTGKNMFMICSARVRIFPGRAQIRVSVWLVAVLFFGHQFV